MCAFRGAIAFLVYNGMKPTKWGIKLYEASESLSGYVWDFEIFAADRTVSNKPTDVVMRLVEPLLDIGRTVYTDNHYCCPELADRLIERETHCVGTVRPNRVGLPRADLAAAAVAPGNVFAMRQGTVFLYSLNYFFYKITQTTNKRYIKYYFTYRIIVYSHVPNNRIAQIKVSHGKMTKKLINVSGPNKHIAGNS